MPARQKPNVKLNAVEITDVGIVRDHNEDAGFVDPDREFFIIADGMGGHAAGEVASAMAVEEVTRSLRAAKPDLEAFAFDPTDEQRRGVVAVLENAVRAAHQAVFTRGVKETDKQGMGTTLDVLLIAGAEAFIAHVGDSRTYLLREGSAAQITTDHTVAEVLVIEGKLSIEEAQASPLRTILVNAIGVSADVGVEISHVRLRKGDRMLICSDGLHDYFPADREIADFLLEGEIESSLRAMVELAKERGGHDNITGIVVEVVECPAPAGLAVRPDARETERAIDTESEDGVPTETAEMEADRSNGVPAAVATVDTLPVEEELDPAAAGAPGPARGADEARRAMRKASKNTLPMGVKAIDDADIDASAYEEATNEGPVSKSAPRRAGSPSDGGSAPETDANAVNEDAAIRKTEPMQAVTVSPADMAASDTVDVTPVPEHEAALAEGNEDANGGSAA